jgi:hypothetical protein
VLISTLIEPLAVHVVGCPTSHKLWTTLVTMFDSQARSRVLQIHYQLATIKKGSSSITEYYHSFKSMCDNLAAASQHLNDFESASYLLAGLGFEYDRSSLLTHMPTLWKDWPYCSSVLPTSGSHLGCFSSSSLLLLSIPAC